MIAVSQLTPMAAAVSIVAIAFGLSACVKKRGDRRGGPTSRVDRKDDESPRGR